jgi:transposase-like protein
VQSNSKTDTKVSEHDQSMGKAIATMADNGQSVERIATLCGIDAREVRRLRKQAPHLDTAEQGPATPIP